MTGSNRLDRALTWLGLKDSNPDEQIEIRARAEAYTLHTSRLEAEKRQLQQLLAQEQTENQRLRKTLQDHIEPTNRLIGATKKLIDLQAEGILE